MELMIVVAIIGVLAAIAIYGVRKYLESAKTAEARNSLGQLGKDAASAYDREAMSGNVLPLAGSTAALHALCTSATNSVPAAASSIKARKYQSSPAEWNTGSSSAGWKCLRFTMDQPQYYMYSYKSPSTDSFKATANGDLDGNGVLSTFELDGQLKKASGGTIVAVSPNLLETDPDE